MKKAIPVVVVLMILLWACSIGPAKGIRESAFEVVGNAVGPAAQQFTGPSQPTQVVMIPPTSTAAIVGEEVISTPLSPTQVIPVFTPTPAGPTPTPGPGVMAEAGKAVSSGLKTAGEAKSKVEQTTIWKEMTQPLAVPREQMIDSINAMPVRAVFIWLLVLAFGGLGVASILVRRLKKSGGGFAEEFVSPSLQGSIRGVVRPVGIDTWPPLVQFAFYFSILSIVPLALSLLTTHPWLNGSIKLAAVGSGILGIIIVVIDVLLEEFLDSVRSLLPKGDYSATDIGDWFSFATQLVANIFSIGLFKLVLGLIPLIFVFGGVFLNAILLPFGNNLFTSPSVLDFIPGVEESFNAIRGSFAGLDTTLFAPLIKSGLAILLRLIWNLFIFELSLGYALNGIFAKDLTTMVLLAAALLVAFIFRYGAPTRLSAPRRTGSSYGGSGHYQYQPSRSVQTEPQTGSQSGEEQ